MIIDKSEDHQMHQQELRKRMQQVKSAKLSANDYAEKLGIEGYGIENIWDLFATGEF